MQENFFLNAFFSAFVKWLTILLQHIGNDVAFFLFNISLMIFNS